jgi:hypothetical protein
MNLPYVISSLNYITGVPLKRSGVAMAALAALILSASPSMAKESPAKRVRNEAENRVQTSAPEVWKVEYRSASTLAEATARNPLLAWAMAMKQRVLEQGSDRWKGVAYGPMAPVDSDDEQISIDKH